MTQAAFARMEAYLAVLAADLGHRVPSLTEANKRLSANFCNKFSGYLPRATTPASTVSTDGKEGQIIIEMAIRDTTRDWQETPNAGPKVAGRTREFEQFADFSSYDQNTAPHQET